MTVTHWYWAEAVRLTDDVVERLRLCEWVDAWGFVGELAGRNLYIDVLAASHNHMAQGVEQLTSALLQARARIDNQQVTIDDLLKSVQQLRQRVR